MSCVSERYFNYLHNEYGNCHLHAVLRTQSFEFVVYYINLFKLEVFTHEYTIAKENNEKIADYIADMIVAYYDKPP